MHKTVKKIAGGFMAAAMTVAAAASTLAPMSAFAGQQLGQTDFDAGVGLPWHTCETNPAKQNFEIADGVYRVTIVNNDGPESRWDLQLRHRKLKIDKGHTYKVHWEVTASTAGEMYTKIGDYGGKNEAWHNNCKGQSDFDQCWSCVKIEKGKNEFDVEFTPTKDIEVAEWAFHYGGKGEHQDVDCFPNDTVLEFDNLSLIDVTSDENDPDPTDEMGVVRPESNVRINQIGYYTNLEKKASYVTDASQPLDFEIRDKSGTAKFKGQTKVFGADPDSGTGKTTTVKVGDKSVERLKDSGENVHIIDFSTFDEEGEYTIFVKDTVGVSGTQVLLDKGQNDTKVSGDKVLWTNPQTNKEYTMNESYPFTISKDVYSTQLLKDSMNYYYQNRSGVPIEEKYVTSGEKSLLAHSKYGHNPDTAYVQSKWVKAYASEFDGEKSKTIDGTGGWYDAGDHGKYVVNGGISVWTLQNAYELTKKNGNDAKWTDGTIAIPENTDKAPDILDEAKVELEWMFKMIDGDGFVYHKLHDHKWTGLATRSWDYDKEKMDNGEKGWGTTRIVKPPTYAATFNMIACAAQAARLWEGIDDSFAKECLSNAETSWKAIIAKESKWNIAEGSSDKDPYFAPLDQAIGGGAYGDSYVGDDAYWAACELYATTGKSDYYDFLKKYKNPNDKSGNDKAFSLTTNLGGGENNGSFSSFNWGCTSGLGTLSLYLSKNTSAEDKATIEKSITAAADTYLEQMSNQGMGIPYKEATFEDGVNIGAGIKITGYEWGSNSFVINNAMVLAYAYDVDHKNVKYINGAAEAMDYIFGRNGLGFSYVSGYGKKTLEWPHHRYWSKGIDPTLPKAPDGVMSGGPGAGMQDPYIGGLGYRRGALANQKCYVDNAESWSTNEVTINWNAPLVWMTTFMMDEAAKADGKGTDPTDPTNPPSGDVVYGDANCDGEVNLSDAVLIMQWAANSEKYAITAQGMKNADCVDNGGGVTSADALAIQMVEAGTISKSDLPITSAQMNALVK